MSAKLYRSLKVKPTLRKCNVNLQPVNAGTLKTLGKVTLNFEIKGFKLSYDFIVADGINRCLILGENWLTDEGVRMYFELGMIRIKGVYAPLVSDKHISSIVRIARGMTLRPNTSYIVEGRCRVSDELKRGTECLVSSYENGIVTGEPGIELRDCFVKLSHENKFPVEITNYNNRFIRRKRGRILGQIQVIDKLNIRSVTCNNVNYAERPGQRRVNSNVNKQEILSQIQTDGQHKHLVENLVLKNTDVFAFSEVDIVPSDLVSMKIELTDETPFKIRPYRAAAEDQKAIDKAVSEWLAAGIVSRSRSPFSSSVVVVSKKCGEKRVCVDLRRLNAAKKAYVVRLPSIDEILSKLGKAKYISTYDLKSVFSMFQLTKGQENTQVSQP